jgi:putative phosphoesterase
VRVAALYDVHGNLPALEAVLDEVRLAAVDAVVSGGDVVWGPQPGECLRLLRDAGAVFVRGNCERLVAAPEGDADEWCAERLTVEERSFVAGLPLGERLGGALFCHATPRSDEEIVTRLSPEQRLREAFGGAGAPLVVCGHTHQQFDRRAGGVRVVNAGSVGLPYDREPGAYWVLAADDVELRRTAYDVERAAAATESSGFPEAQLFNVLREPPDPDQVAALFEARAGA